MLNLVGVSTPQMSGKNFEHVSKKMGLLKMFPKWELIGSIQNCQRSWCPLLPTDEGCGWILPLQWDWQGTSIGPGSLETREHD